jgi:hypothetical protein
VFELTIGLKEFRRKTEIECWVGSKIFGFFQEKLCQAQQIVFVCRFSVVKVWYSPDQVS